jgi:ATP-dependent RNA helicase DeaD
LPLICRRGHIGKADVGRIRIFDRETRFEVTADVAERVAAAVRRPDAKDGQIRIEPVAGRDGHAATAARRPRRDGERHGGRPPTITP